MESSAATSDFYGALARLHEALKPRTYLEIGVGTGESLMLAQTDTLCIGVAPDPKPHGHRAPQPLNAVIFEETSDKFFATRDLDALLHGDPLDFAFIHRSHLFEHALRDLVSIEANSHVGTVVAVHDCLPLDAPTSSCGRTDDARTGDVWKLVACLHKYRPDLDVTLADASPSGLCIISGLDRHSNILPALFERLLDEYVPLSCDPTRAERAATLSGLTVSVDEAIKRVSRMRGQGSSALAKRRPLIAAVAATEARLSDTQTENDELRAEAAQLRAELAAHDARLSDVYASTSWRLSVPLRLAGRLSQSARSGRVRREAGRLARLLSPGLVQQRERGIQRDARSESAASRSDEVSVPATPYHLDVRSESATYLPEEFLSATLRPQPTAGSERRSVTIVVPVHRGVDDTRRCLESVLNARIEADFRLVIVDDATPEPALRDYVDSLDHRDGVLVLHNADNVGYVESVNRGMREARPDDVVLLNSDTVVADGWLDRLVAHARSHERVGTVTPFSNNATICSYPDLRGMPVPPPGETVETLAEAFAVANCGRAVEVPTAVGFCMFVSRECLEDVGPFDADAFGLGYGEENDFCLRAARRGWRHLLAADTFVWHRGEVSFGEQAVDQKAAGMEVLRHRYPRYLDEVDAWVRGDPARPSRVAATAARFRFGSTPVILLVTHHWGGGTERHVGDLLRRFDGRARFLVLRSSGTGYVSLESAASTDALRLIFAAGDDEAFLARLLQSFGVARIHVHQLVDMPIDVRRLVDRLQVPLDFTVHDYFTLCPRVRLTRVDGTHCGQPTDLSCEACLRQEHPYGATSMVEWQGRFAWLYQAADRVICPSSDVAQRIREVHSVAPCVVVPHEDLTAEVWPEVSAPPCDHDGSLRIGVLGALIRDKGARALFDAAALVVERQLPLEFYLVGEVLDEGRSRTAPEALHITGRYALEELPGLLRRVDSHLIWFPAQWPETYSYTLSEAFAAGLPVVAPALGAFSERLAGRPWSWLVGHTDSPQAHVERFAKLRLENFVPGVPPSPSVAACGLEPCHGFYEQSYLCGGGCGEHQPHTRPDASDMCTAATGV